MPNNKNKKTKIDKQTEKVIDDLLQQIALKNSKKIINGGFTIPDKFLGQLSEFTNGGFMLFTFDSDGHPRCYQNFDNDTYNLAMSNFVRMYANCMENMHGSMIMNGMMSPSDEDEGEDAGKAS